MKKFAFVFALLSLVGGTQTASAQYYQTSACTTLTQTLSTGSRGSEVLTLQTFLSNQDYKGGGAWMITGYFGAATRQAVRNFQATQNLPVTGVVDAATRAAISSVTCGNVDPSSYYQAPYSYSTQPTYSYPYTGYQYPTQYPTQYPYDYNYQYSYQNPSYYPQCGLYGSVCPTAQLAIHSLSPQSAAVGTSVTIYGQGFSTTGNTVRFGTGIITNLSSPDTRSVSFVVPTNLTGYGSYPVTVGTYNISVSNNAGQTSNALPFSVSSLGAGSSPSISSFSGPTSLTVNTQGTWAITFYNPSSQYANVQITWGDEYLYPYASAMAPQSIYNSGTQNTTFTHSYSQPGTYTVTARVTNAAGLSQTTSTTVSVTGAGSTGSVSLSSVTPTTGRIGQQVVLQGSGFTTLNNTIHFGNGGQQYAVSNNGTHIYYTIPAYLSACDINSTYVCTMQAQLVTPGTYPLYVTNSNGTTQTLYFTVTQ